MTTTNNTKIQDLMKSFSANTKTMAENYQKNLKNVKCVSSADLMSNYIAGTSIDARFQFEVVQDAGGDPILFSISSPEDTGGGANVNQLYVTMRNEDEPTGWQQFNISPTATDSVTIIGVSQDLTSGDYVLAAATASGFYITSTISSDTTKTDWTNFSADWFARPGMPSGASVTKILVGENQTVGKLPLIIAAVQIGSNAEHYFVNGDTTISENCWSNYVLPAQTATLVDLAIGMVYFDNDYWLGTYALYTVGSDLNLTFSSVPDGTNITHSFQLAAPAGTTVLQTLPDINDANVSTLFVSGNGLYVFESQTQMNAADASPKTVAQATLISDDAAFSSVTQMLARQDDSHVSLWVRNNSQVLWYVRGDQLGADDTAPRNWTTPLSLRQNVARIAAIRNKNRKANAVLMVKSDGKTVAYLWQDPTTTLWKDSDMPLPALSTVQEFPCYTSVLAFTDTNGNPVINQEVNITSSQWTYATVNGFYKTLDSTTPVAVKTDATGKVTIINKVTSLSTSKAMTTEPSAEENTTDNTVASISTPSFSANAPFMTESHTINPAQNILAGLANITTGQDLLNAKTKFTTAPDPTNNPEQYVITGDLRNNPAQLDQIAASIQQAVAMANTLPDSTDSSSSIASRGSSFQPWGLSFAGNGATFFNGDSALNLFPQTDSFGGGTIAGAIVSVAGDVFEAMLNGIEKVGQILVQAAGAVYNICVQIGEQILSFVIQTVGDVLNLLSWIFQAIEVGVEKLIGWLGFVFDWDDIITTHNVLTNMMTQTLDYVSALVSDSKTPIDNFFNELKTKVENLPILQIPDGTKLPAEANVNLFQANQQAQTANPTAAATAAPLQTDPGYNFTTYQTSHAVATSGSTASSSVPDVDVPDKLLTDVENVVADLQNLFTQFLQDNKTTFDSLVQLFDNNDLTIANILKVVSEGVIVTVLDLAQGLVDLLIDLTAALIDFVQKIMTAEIDLPFISGLYKKVTGGSNFSILDSLSLFYAIPTTIGYKILYNEAPFANGTYGLDTGTYEQFFPMPSAGASLTASATGGGASLTASATGDSDSPPAWKCKYSRVGLFAYNINQIMEGIIQTVDLGRRNLEDKLDKETDPKAKAALKGKMSRLESASKWLSGFDIFVKIATVGFGMPLSESDSPEDVDEFWIDMVLWGGDIVELLLTAILYVLEKCGKMTEEIKELFESIYQFILGGVTCILDLVSFIIELIGATKDDGTEFDPLKQVQNFVTAGGEISGGLGGWVGYASKKDKEPDSKAALVATAGTCVAISIFLAFSSTGISVIRMLTTAGDEIVHLR